MTTASLAESLPKAIRDKLLERAVQQTPVAYFSLFENSRKRDGKNDPDLTGRMDIPVARIQEELAQALAKGHTNIQVYMDLWATDKTTGPCITGRARNVVPDEKRFVPAPQQADAPADEAGEESQTETPVTP